MNTDIFIRNNDKPVNVSFKLSYTDILESIPSQKLSHPICNWEKYYETEWRWRFLRFYDHKLQRDRFVTEISHLDKNIGKRQYMDKHGKWVSDINVNSIYDNYVIEEYYVYVK